MRSLRLAGPVLALACALAAAACGVEPTRVADAGPAPVISARGAAGTIYLLRGGRLAPKNVTTASPAVEDLITALFEVGRQPGDGLGTALRGFRLEQSVLGRYGVDSGVRNDPENPVGLRLHVIVNGPGTLGRTAMAQITCTARLREEIWAVKITQTTPKGPLALGEHTCKEYHRLAAPSVNLPP
ncbi:hypothetical protein Skr01_45810 [Sphaerisporangium krabiense]|uniref:GerMN domain-containing protein n=1 Tax=Sphaerisporangium krabiense TaxID=763782 RepID=A0A7W9DQB5_9ACTN|nr:hypothetical protein [Sphaerisporangium krabiense]MBB5627367.1 hypothetical protein [Sphaerisporangium krabiense]GII64496.1 hypothetical protein Skr01_45810 [Sphaerisporangium krabiense]